MAIIREEDTSHQFVVDGGHLIEVGLRVGKNLVEPEDRPFS